MTRFHWFAAACSALLWVGLGGHADRPRQEPSPRPALLGRIEPAHAQPTAEGRQLATLQVFGRRLYAGYGDYTADTGPIAIAAIDLDTGAIGPTLLSYASEAVLIFRQLGGELFAPDIDPRRTQMGGFARGVAGAAVDQWTDEKVVRATHIFDAATFDGRDLWLFGSLGSNAVAWRSVDRGRTWTEALTVSPRWPGAFARFYSAVTLRGLLYAQAVDFPGGAHRESRVFDGERWTDGPRLLPPDMSDHDVFPWRAQLLGAEAIYLDQHAATSHRPVRLYRFDGRQARVAFGPADRRRTAGPEHLVVDAVVEGETAFVLNRLQEVWSSSDLAEWRRRAVFDAGAGERATSIAVSGGDLYVGTDQSRVYRMPLSR